MALISNTLVIKPCSQTTEMAIKRFGDTIKNLGITMLTFQNIPGNWSDASRTEPQIKIKSLTGLNTGIVTLNNEGITRIIKTLGNNVSDAVYFIANNIIYGISSSQTSSNIIPPNYAVPTILSNITVTLTANDTDYSYSFPVVSDLASWGAILQTGIVTFTKVS